MSTFRCLFLLLLTGLLFPLSTFAHSGEVTDCYRVTVDNLRVRSKPGTTNNKVLFSLAENTLVRYLGEKSDFTTQVTLRGKDYDEPWYKVETHGGQQGWLYGGAVTPHPNTDGQKKLKYEIVLRELDPHEPKSVTTALRAYTALYCPEISPDAQVSFLEFRRFYTQVAEEMDSNLPYEGDEFTELENYAYNRKSNPNLNPPANIAKWVTPGEENGFYLRGGPEGGVFWDKKANFLLDNFKACLDGPMVEYLTQQAMEDGGELLFQDASYGIGPMEAAERAVFWEDFVENHEEFPILSDCKYRYDTYYSMLFCQLDNTPFFDYQTGKLYEEYQKVYTAIITTWPETQVGEDVKELFELLKLNEFKDTEEVKAHRKKKVKEVTGRDWCF